MKASYEPGMKITYERDSKRVVLTFRGRITVLPDTYESEDLAIAAGEALCRLMGWNPRAQEQSRKLHFRSAF